MSIRWLLARSQGSVAFGKQQCAISFGYVHSGVLFLLLLLAFVFVAFLGILNLITGGPASALHGGKKDIFWEVSTRSMLTPAQTANYSGSYDLQALAALMLASLLLLLLAFVFVALGILNLLMDEMLMTSTLHHASKEEEEDIFVETNMHHRLQLGRQLRPPWHHRLLLGPLLLPPWLHRLRPGRQLRPPRHHRQQLGQQLWPSRHHRQQLVQQMRPPRHFRQQVVRPGQQLQPLRHLRLQPGQQLQLWVYATFLYT